MCGTAVSAVRTQARRPCHSSSGSAKLWLLPALIAIIVLASGPNVVRAEDPTEDAREVVREIYVPFEDLNVLLENQPRRVLLSRAEYEELLTRARQTPQGRAPREAAIVSADYEAVLEEGRARITGALAVDVLEDGLHTVALQLDGVGLRAAGLDDKGAPIGVADDGRLVLFVEGKGQHRLVLDMVAPVEMTAARQTLGFLVPTPAATRMHLIAPGDVEVKSGAGVVSRVLDEGAGVTRFELLPPRGKVSLVMTLNSRLQRRDRVVIARGVLVDEITEAYERIHLTSSMEVLHKAVDNFRFAVPECFEITHVRSPQLACWGMSVEGGRRILDIRLRETTTDTVVLNLSAIRTGPRLESWTLPRIEPLDVAGEVAVVGLLIEDRLKATSIEANGLIPIDTGVLSQALPATIFEAEPGAPRVRPVLAYYAPRAGFGLAARFEKPPPRLLVTTNLLLVLEEKGQQIRGGFTLLPEVETLFELDFTVPADWLVTSVTTADGDKLPIERHGEPGGASRIHVRLPRGVPADQQHRVYFQADRTPPGWLGNWQSRSVEFPVFAVAGAAREEGAIAVAAHDDMSVRPEGLEQLTPLDEHEKDEYGLTGVGTNLAYRFEDPTYAARLTVERIAPRLTARSYSFFTIETDVLVAHYEIAYDVEEARTQKLALMLDEGTPTTLAIRGLDGVALKEYSSEPAGGIRRWTVLLADARRDTIRLAVDFQQPLADRQPQEASGPRGLNAAARQDLTLPVVLADGVAYQSGIVSVEGSAELDVQVRCGLRKVDIGELVDAEYQPGKRLLGAYGFVGDSPDVGVSVVRRGGYALPPVIVQRAELVTSLSEDGISQTAARYRLRTKVPFIEVELPRGSSLWSAELDGKPAKPQREGQKLLLSLLDSPRRPRGLKPAAPPATDEALRDLRIVYETPVAPVAFLTDVDLPAPTLRLPVRHRPLVTATQPAAAATSEEVPIADLVWHLHLPTGTYVVPTQRRSYGTVSTDQLQPPETALASILKCLYRLSGGVHPFYDGYACMSLGYREAAPAKSLRVAASRAPTGAPPPAERTQMDEAASELEGLESLGYVGDVDDKARRVPSRRPAVTVPEDAAAVAGESPVGPPSRKAKDYWALHGVRSLKIDLQSTGGRQITFRSLGGRPRLALTLANRRRSDALAWGLALIVGLVGLAWTGRPVRTRAMYILIVALVATLLPLIAGLPELIDLCNKCFYAACLLVPCYLVASAVRWLAMWIRRVRVPVIPTTAVSVIVSLLASVPAAEATPRDDDPRHFVINVVEPPALIEVPEDAIILPYDPDSKTSIKEVSQLLVPYDRFVELWNRAYPDKRIEAKHPPAPYALAGAMFSTAIEAGEFLLIEGSLDIDIYGEDCVSIPLPIEGGVLARADLDGQPARLGVVGSGPPPRTNDSSVIVNRQSPMIDPEAAAGPLVTLYASGKGRHRLELALRMRLERRGGWRVANGRLPAAPASGLTIRVPEAKTEVRLGGVSDRRSYVTNRADELISTTHGPDGALALQWRPKVSEGTVDRAVTAVSTVVLDVQEDGLMAVWHVELQFRGSEREFFSVNVPRDYIVAKVAGGNVRGWEVRPAEQGQRLDVSLLKPAKESENFTIHLWRQGPVGQEDFTEFDVPMVTVDEAALHGGRLIIRRSPLLDVRTVSTAGVTRSDLPEDMGGNAEADGVSPLGIRPYEAYRFAAMPCSIRLSASPVVVRASAYVQALLRIAERWRSLEAKVNVNVLDRRCHHLRLLLPADLDVEHVSAPGDFEWSLTNADDGKLLSIHLSTGRMHEVPILVRGTLGRRGGVTGTQPGAVVELPLPRLEVLDMESQQGDIVVQVDPSFDVQAVNLVECESVLLKRVYGWLDAKQRQLARLVLHYRSPGYGGVLRLSARRPTVTCQTITNVRVTDRALEETVLLDFAIRNAGIRELSFLLPERMKDARISVPLLRQKTVESAKTETSAVLNTAHADAMVRVRLELQDAVMDELRVLVEDDRLLTPGIHTVPIPIVEMGRTDQRYVVLESAGRGEVVIEKQEGLAALRRQQKEWRFLVGILAGEPSHAYQVTGGAGGLMTEPVLSFKVKDRSMVETVGARIGLAQAQLVLDATGAYRAVHTYRIHNSTEQFLEIELPAGAALWTARVAGEAVKPVEAQNSAEQRHVRIPIVKTAPGDLDYEVLLTYGGKLPALGRLSSVELPLIRSVNINAELSQVTLLVPEDYRWFDFDGTMRRVEDESELAAGYVSYQTELAQRLSETMRGAGSFAQLRAADSLERLKEEIGAFQATVVPQEADYVLREAWTSNAVVLSKAEQQIQTLRQTMERDAGRDNRSNISEHYERQRMARARGAVKDVGQNFGDLALPVTGETDASAEQFDRRWLDSNGLAGVIKPDMQDEKSHVAIQSEEGKLAGMGGGGRGSGRIGGRRRAPSKPSAPQVAQGEVMRELQEADGEYAQRHREQPESGTRRGARKQTVERYQEVLEQRAAQKPVSSAVEQAESQARMGLALAGRGVATTLGEDVVPPTGLASLDVEIPARGTVYRFTTPRGRMEITARAVSRPFLANVEFLGITAVAILAIWRVYRLVRRPGFTETHGRALSTAIIVAGLASLATGVLPIAGLGIAIAGIAVKVRIARNRYNPAQPAD
ncbi:MAG: hypothetical protein JXQ75_01845 [Phycisphaerae bacterium]|nr:hypothetical protein [Phycisphaerae bacterium]